MCTSARVRACVRACVHPWLCTCGCARASVLASVRACVRACVYLGQQFGCVLEVLPVDPGAQVVHHPLLDLLLDALVRLGLQLEGLVVVLPLEEQQQQHHHNIR